MPAKVVDVSAVAAMILGEPEGLLVAESLKDHRLAAPGLLEYEMASVCLKKLRAHPQRRPEILQAHGRFLSMEIEYSPVSAPGVLELAEKTGLSAYDASYLWLSLDRGLQLVTLDKKLERSAGDLERN